MADVETFFKEKWAPEVQSICSSCTAYNALDKNLEDILSQITNLSINEVCL